MFERDNGPSPEFAHRVGGSPHPRGDLVDRDLLEITQDEDLAIVGRQAGQCVGEQDGLLAADGEGTRRGDRIGQLLLNRQAGAVKKHVERFLTALVAPPGLVMLGLVGQGPNQDLAEPGNQLPLSRTSELSKLAVSLQKRLLDQVGGIELDLERWADQGAGHDPEIVPVQLQKPAQCRLITGEALSMSNDSEDRERLRHR